MFLFRIAGISNGIFFRQRMNGAAFRSADLSALIFGRLLVRMGWSQKIRRQKLSTGQALQHRQGKEESKNVG